MCLHKIVIDMTFKAAGQFVVVIVWLQSSKLTLQNAEGARTPYPSAVDKYLIQPHLKKKNYPFNTNFFEPLWYLKWIVP